jgi:hypothetical protein
MALLQAVLAAASPSLRGELDLAALAAHCTMLEHGFVCVGVGEPEAGDVPTPSLASGPGGSVTLTMVPPGWNAKDDTYAFGYIHPLRDAKETFTMKAVAVGANLMVHAASSALGGDLLTASLAVDRTAGAAQDGDLAAAAKRAAVWQEKVAASVAMQLLGKVNSTARFSKALEQEKSASTTAASSTKEAVGGGGTKRPAPEDERRWVHPEDEPRFHPDLDPFTPGFLPTPIWRPDGNLLGPRHPAWGQRIPGRGDGGMLPRFDPIGPGLGDPNPDHLQVPGFITPDRFPAFQGGATGRGRMDPDGMFIM